jgi:hypothetical protein
VEGVPLVARMSAAPTLEPGALVRLEVTEVDLIERSLGCVYRESLGKVQNLTGEAGQKA